MTGLSYCEALQRQYGHKLEEDFNHIQSQHKSVTPSRLLANRVLNFNNDILKMFDKQ